METTKTIVQYYWQEVNKALALLKIATAPEDKRAAAGFILETVNMSRIRDFAKLSKLDTKSRAVVLKFLQQIGALEAKRKKLLNAGQFTIQAANKVNEVMAQKMGTLYVTMLAKVPRAAVIDMTDGASPPINTTTPGLFGLCAWGAC